MPKIKMVRKILVLPPIGLGDTVAWLPFLIQAEKILNGVVLSFPDELEWMAPIYEGSNLRNFKFVKFEVASLERYECAFLLNDEKHMLAKYAPILAMIPERLGLRRGRHRASWLTKTVSPSFFGRPMHESLRNLRLLLALGVKPARTVLSDCSLDATFGQELALKKIIEEDYVVLHPYSHGHAREWPTLNYFELGRRFREAGFRVILTGSKSEQKLLASYSEIISAAGLDDYSGQLNLRELMQLLASACLMIGASTGPTHLAAALGTKTIGLYPAKKGLGLGRWAPLGNKAIGLQKNRCKQKFCDQDDCECMSYLSISMVEHVAISMIKSPKKLSSGNIAGVKIFVPSAGVLS